MQLITSDPAVRRLVEQALKKSGVPPGNSLRAWNARLRLRDDAVIMEAGTPIYLDLVLQSLRIFTGMESLPHDWGYLPVHAMTPARRRRRERHGGAR